MKVIFLDVDGELTYMNYSNSSTANIDADKVKLLRQICDATGAKVVISSSWRGSPNHKPRIYTTLRYILDFYGIDVIGDTPFVETEFNNDVRESFNLDEINTEYNIKFGTGRAEEIHRWIKDNQPESFVILDDEEWNWAEYGYDKYWVRPSYWEDFGGLQPEHVEKAIKILNGEI